MILDQADTSILPQGIPHLVRHVVGTGHGEAHDAHRGKFTLRRRDRDQLRILAHRADGRIHAVGVDGRIDILARTHDGTVHRNLGGRLVISLNPLIRSVIKHLNNRDILRLHPGIRNAAGRNADDIRILRRAHGNIAGGAIDQLHLNCFLDRFQNGPSGLFVVHLLSPPSL